MTSCAWLWIYAGALLVLLELIVPGFILCFFGLAAASVGVCRFIFGLAFSPAWQFAAFSLFSVFYILALRHWLKSTFTGAKECTVADFEHVNVGRIGSLIAPIVPPCEGRVLLGDAEWVAIADAPIAAGVRVKVVSQENLTMKVEEIKS